MIADSYRPLTRHRMRSPRAVALVVIIFSLLLGTSVVLIQLSIPDVPPYDAYWLSEQASRVTVAVILIPFAGIAFLWFMGVIRDQLGEMEDQFFSSVFWQWPALSWRVVRLDDCHRVCIGQFCSHV